MELPINILICQSISRFDIYDIEQKKKKLLLTDSAWHTCCKALEKLSMQTVSSKFVGVV